MSLQGPQLGTLFFFILDTNILNQPVDIVYKLAEAFFQDNQFLLAGYVQLLLIIVPGILNLSDCAGEADDRPAPADRSVYISTTKMTRAMPAKIRL